MTALLSLPPDIFRTARLARKTYDELVAYAAAGVTITAAQWLAVHADIHYATCDLVEAQATGEYPLLTPGVIQALADCGADAWHRAERAEQLVAQAKRGRVIDMATLQAVAS